MEACGRWRAVSYHLAHMILYYPIWPSNSLPSKVSYLVFIHSIYAFCDLQEESAHVFCRQSCPNDWNRNPSADPQSEHTWFWDTNISKHSPKPSQACIVHIRIPCSQRCLWLAGCDMLATPIPGHKTLISSINDAKYTSIFFSLFLSSTNNDSNKWTFFIAIQGGGL